MNVRVKREVVAISYFFLFFLLLIIIAGGVLEFIFWPSLAWMLGSDGYRMPSIDRLCKWGEVILIVSPVCSIIMWLYEKILSGR
jgi:hypothetical protein